MPNIIQSCISLGMGEDGGENDGDGEEEPEAKKPKARER